MFDSFIQSKPGKPKVESIGKVVLSEHWHFLYNVDGNKRYLRSDRIIPYHLSWQESILCHVSTINVYIMLL